MMSEETKDKSTETKRKRKRRRRRKRPSTPAGQASSRTAFDNVLVAEDSSTQGPTSKRRRQVFEVSGASVSVPSSGRNPHHQRNSRSKRKRPASVAARRRKFTKLETKQVRGWLADLPDTPLATLYKGLGGQPKRITNRKRLLELTLRAVTQSDRLSSVVRQLPERERQVLVVLLQCGSIAQSTEVIRELLLSYGGSEREWERSLITLAGRGLLLAQGDTQQAFFYVVPPPLVPSMLHALENELMLSTFENDDVRTAEQKPFCAPLDFSITTLATYIDQHAPRFTQRHELYRTDREQMDAFFAQIWDPDSELFNFHLDFLMMHKLVELRSDYLALNHEVMDEWLNLEPEDQRDLLFQALNKRFELGEWVLWALHRAGEGWVPERPLASMYRRWKKGEDWRARYKRGHPQATRHNTRESYSFATLVQIGLIEMGQWGQQKCYRLAPRGRYLLDPQSDDGFRQFYLTPNFEIMAPAGLAPILLFRIGELAELVGCDRANTYKITDAMIERSLKRGWRRDDVLQFLRDNSQIGLPDNVESTLKGWMGHQGDVEFHDLCLLTVHRSQIRQLERQRHLKPYLLHRFVPGMYAVDRNRRDELTALLRECGLDPTQDVRGYPGAPEQVAARQQLHTLVSEARQNAVDPSKRAEDLVEASGLKPVPGASVASIALETTETNTPLPQVTPSEARVLIDQALATGCDLTMVYRTREEQALRCQVQPQRIALKAEAPVLVGLDRDEGERRTFVLDRIERMRMMEAP